MGQSLFKPIAQESDDRLHDPLLAGWTNTQGTYSVQQSSTKDYSLMRGAKRRKQSRLTPHEKERLKNIQSLDFGVIDNQLHREHVRARTKFTHLRRTFTKWFICFMIGLLTGCIAFGIKKSVDQIQEFKFTLVTDFLYRGKTTQAFVMFLLSNVALASASVVFIFLAGPLAGGSGIPEVKGILNGIRIPHTLGIKILIGKISSLVLAYASGLIIGPEGPMIHIGSAVGSLVGQLRRVAGLNSVNGTLWKFHNDRDQRDFISTGAAAGITAAFGAPIGGVLFSIEEASTHWSRELTWRTFFCCLVATLTVNFLLQGVGSAPDMHDYGMLTFGFSRFYLFHYAELIAFALIGVIGGVMGALFIEINLLLTKLRQTYLGESKIKHLIEVILMTALTSCAVFYISLAFPCRTSSLIVHDTLACEEEQTLDLESFTCDPSQEYNQMASLIFGNPSDSLKRLYSRTNNMFTGIPLVIFTSLYFAFSVSAAGLWVAGGTFVPNMMIGAGFGRLAGEILRSYLPASQIDPSIYALIGSAAMMGGYSRMTVSLVVIMVELTEGTQYLLPIIMAVMISKWVGDLFGMSLYDHLMELKSIPFLHHSASLKMAALSVHDIMSTPVIALKELEHVRNIVQVLRSNNHHAYPVVSPGPDDSMKVFRGIILRSQLLILLRYKTFQADSHLRLSYTQMTYMLSGILPPLDVITQSLTLSDLSICFDLRPYMNCSCITIHDTFSYTEAYKLFVTMGLRHLPVIDVNNEVVGVITRKDLL